MRSDPRALLLTLILAVPALLPYEAAAAPGAERPARLMGGARYFARSVRPVEPRSSLGLQAGHVWGNRAPGVEREQWRWSLLLEGALGRAGVGVEIPVVLDRAIADGVYGEGSGSVLGVGDIRLAADVRILRFSLGAAPVAWGAGIQVSLPTGKARLVEPDNPVLSAPDVSFGPARWTLSGGTALALGPVAGFSMQLNGDLIGILRDAVDRPLIKEDWLFGAVALNLAYAGLPWLVPMVQVDAQFEIIGINPLRQLFFVGPALRVRPHPRVRVDVGVRIPVGAEAEKEHRLSVGVVLAVGLGREGDEAW